MHGLNKQLLSFPLLRFFDQELRRNTKSFFYLQSTESLTATWCIEPVYDEKVGAQSETIGFHYLEVESFTHSRKIDIVNNLWLSLVDSKMELLKQLNSWLFDWTSKQGKYKKWPGKIDGGDVNIFTVSKFRKIVLLISEVCFNQFLHRKCIFKLESFHRSNQFHFAVFWSNQCFKFWKKKFRKKSIWQLL